MAGIRITGGADAHTAAALVVVVQRVLDDEAEAASRPEGRPTPSPWTWSARLGAHWRGPGSPDTPLSNRPVH